MSYYLVIFQGGGAVGSAVFGLVAQRAGLQDALLAAAALLAVGGGIGARRPFKALSPEDLLPVGDWPEPQHAADASLSGPVQVTVEYNAKPGRADELIDAIRAGRYARRRTGAISWQVWSDAAEPDRICEQFTVGSWEEHERQHERISRHDEQRLQDIRALSDPARPAKVTHWVAAVANKTIKVS